MPSIPLQTPQSYCLFQRRSPDGSPPHPPPLTPAYHCQPLPQLYSPTRTLILLFSALRHFYFYYRFFFCSRGLRSARRILVAGSLIGSPVEIVAGHRAINLFCQHFGGRARANVFTPKGSKTETPSKSSPSSENVTTKNLQRGNFPKMTLSQIHGQRAEIHEGEGDLIKWEHRGKARKKQESMVA